MVTSLKFLNSNPVKEVERKGCCARAGHGVLVAISYKHQEQDAFCPVFLRRVAVKLCRGLRELLTQKKRLCGNVPSNAETVACWALATETPTTSSTFPNNVNSL